MSNYPNSLSGRLRDDDLITPSLLNSSADKLEEYENALKSIVNAKTIEEAAMIALVALM